MGWQNQRLTHGFFAKYKQTNALRSKIFIPLQLGNFVILAGEPCLLTDEYMDGKRFRVSGFGFGVRDFESGVKKKKVRSNRINELRTDLQLDP